MLALHTSDSDRIEWFVQIWYTKEGNALQCFNTVTLSKPHGYAAMQSFWASHFAGKQYQLDLKQMETNQLNPPGVHLSCPVMGSVSCCASANVRKRLRSIEDELQRTKNKN